jgi:hypothetical protein
MVNPAFEEDGAAGSAPPARLPYAARPIGGRGMVTFGEDPAEMKFNSR